ncbi:MAG TPA: hypothetical protein EYP67_02570, partial [Methanosarcinales archaeon]|nr:hypothetical protein [Methanosarcinales archaeon]
MGEVVKEVARNLLRYILPDDWSEVEKEKNPIAADEVVSNYTKVMTSQFNAPILIRAPVILRASSGV